MPVLSNKEKSQRARERDLHIEETVRKMEKRHKNKAHSTTNDKKAKISFEAKTSKYINELFGVTTPEELPDDFDVYQIQKDDETEFDLTNIVSKSIDPVTGIPRDVRLPEGDFKEAKNFFDYCENFRGDDTSFPFARQMWFATHLFSEWCPKCSHPRWHDFSRTPVRASKDSIKERVVFLEYGVCPKCGARKVDLIRKGKLNNYGELDILLGQRSGKSTTTSAITEYIVHKYLKFPKMSTICRGIQSSTELSGTFVGLRFADALSLLWIPISKGINDSRWFQDYHAMLADYGQRLGMEFFRMKDIYLRYMHKNLEFSPAGPSKRALRGRTRIVTGTDELGWFPVGEKEGENDERERADADEVYTALDRSLLTMRTEHETLLSKGYSNFLNGIAINLSSPSDENDKMSRLIRENQNSKIALAVQAATWDVNPFYSRDSEYIREQYKKDPVKAARDYGAIPPTNSKTFIVPSTVASVFSAKNRVTYTTEDREIGDAIRRAGILESTTPETPCPPTLLSLDAGYTNNSFSVTVLNLEEKLNKDGSMDAKIRVPAVIEIIPENGVSLHYGGIYKQIIKPLIKAFNTRFVFADRWNSIALLDSCMEDFATMQLVAKQYSVKYNDFLMLRSYLAEKKIILPELEKPPQDIEITNYPHCFNQMPMNHLYFQMGKVRDIGKSVVKAKSYTDDTFRALVLGTSRIMDPKIREALREFNKVVTRGPIAGAVVSGHRMGFSGIYRPGMSKGIAVSTAGDLGHTGGQYGQQTRLTSVVVAGRSFR